MQRFLLFQLLLLLRWPYSYWMFSLFFSTTFNFKNAYIHVFELFPKMCQLLGTFLISYILFLRVSKTLPECMHWCLYIFCFSIEVPNMLNQIIIYTLFNDSSTSQISGPSFCNYFVSSHYSFNCLLTSHMCCRKLYLWCWTIRK